MEAVNNRSNSIGGARELITTGATALERAIRAANNGAGWVRETVDKRIKGAGGP